MDEGGHSHLVGVAPPGEPMYDREPLEEDTVSEARDADRVSGVVISIRTGMSDRMASLQKRPSSLSPAQAERSDGHPPAGCDTKVAEGVPRDAEDCSFSCHVGPTAAGHGLRGLSSCTKGTRSRRPHSAPGNLTPKAFTPQALEARKIA